MKNIFVLILLVFSTSIYSQNIESDPLFLQYETEYLNGDFRKLDHETHEKKLKQFFNSFNNSKSVLSFKKSKDKFRWLEKNLDRTNFKDVSTSKDLYNTILQFEEKQNIASQKVNNLRVELEKKYEGKDIFYTIKKRLENK